MGIDFPVRIERAALDVAEELASRGARWAHSDWDVPHRARVRRQQLPVVREALEHRDVDALVRLIGVGVVDPGELFKCPAVQRRGVLVIREQRARIVGVSAHTVRSRIRVGDLDVVSVEWTKQVHEAIRIVVLGVDGAGTKRCLGRRVGIG